MLREFAENSLGRRIRSHVEHNEWQCISFLMSTVSSGRLLARQKKFLLVNGEYQLQGCGKPSMLMCTTFDENVQLRERAALSLAVCDNSVDEM